MEKGDSIILIVLVIVFVLWGFRYLRNWWYTGPTGSPDVDIDPEIPVTEAVALLEHAGYEVMTMKRRIPIQIRVDGGEEEGGESYDSRVYIDHFARADEELYIVKIEKERKRMDWTGSGLRDHLLTYSLLFPDAAGILVVNLETSRIRLVEFVIDL